MAECKSILNIENINDRAQIADALDQRHRWMESLFLLLAADDRLEAHEAAHLCALGEGLARQSQALTDRWNRLDVGLDEVRQMLQGSVNHG